MAEGKLGSADLAAGIDTLLFESAVTPQTFNIRFANRTTGPAKIRLAIGTGASPATQDYIDYDVSLLPNGILEDVGLVASAGEKVWARSDISGVSVRAHGM